MSKRRLIVCCFVTLLLLVTTLAAENEGLEHKKPAVSYSQRSFLIHGKPLLLLSGSIHYARVPPSDWNNVFQMAKEMGLNCIQTYVIWSEHEPVPGGDLNWEGYGDLNRFIDLAAANDLHVVLRIGPYICGEYYFGGIPLWMRHVRDEQGNEIGCFRCPDPLWKREMQRWVSTVVDKVRHQLASNGGPIIFMQVENEYEPDDPYLEWAVDMARELTTEVPWSLCGHNITQCNKLNGRHGELSAKKGLTNKENKVVCTVNGFWVDKSVRGDQPSPAFFQKLWPENPTQPAVWTEDQGWFDIWQMGKRVRSTSDQLYGIARFLAYGGSYHNFYMLTGGNHYERRAGRDATTAYAPDTAIDNLLLRHEPRFSSFRNFFKAVRSAEKELLMQAVPVTPIPLKPAVEGAADADTTAELHKFGSLAFLSNFGETVEDSGYFTYQGGSYFLPNHTVVLLNSSSSKVLFNTSATIKQEETRSLSPLESTESRIPVTNWASFQEKIGYGAITTAPLESPEQLNITDNKSDYMWYTFRTSDVGKISVKAIGWGGLQYVYVEDSLSDRIDWNKDDSVDSSTSRLLKGDTALAKLSNQEKRIDIFSVAMGMSTVISPQTGKGIESVMIGEGNRNHTKFATAWKLKGEAMEIYTEAGAKRVDWKPIPSSTLQHTDGLLWFKGSFDVPKSLHPFVGGAQPNQTALVINLNGMNKGVAYVNGFNVGRYWLALGECEGDCAPPRHGPHCFLHFTHCGLPTQDLYHVPFEVLKPKGNTLTLFEEGPSKKQRSLEDVFLEIMHDHQT